MDKDYEKGYNDGFEDCRKAVLALLDRIREMDDEKIKEMEK